MRVGFPGGPRLEWYDRDPLGREYQYDVPGVAPYAAFDRFVYTTPAGKKFFLENAAIRIRRKTAATAVGIVTAFIDARGYSVQLTRLETNTVDDKESSSVGHSVIMLPGDALVGTTEDTSTGGAVDYFLSAHGTQFSA